jgi:hypothetical protein
MAVNGGEVAVNRAEYYEVEKVVKSGQVAVNLGN